MGEREGKSKDSIPGLDECFFDGGRPALQALRPYVTASQRRLVQGRC